MGFAAFFKLKSQSEFGISLSFFHHKSFESDSVILSLLVRERNNLESFFSAGKNKM